MTFFIWRYNNTIYFTNIFPIIILWSLHSYGLYSPSWWWSWSSLRNMWNHITTPLQSGGEHTSSPNIPLMMISKCHHHIWVPLWWWSIVINESSLISRFNPSKSFSSRGVIPFIHSTISPMSHLVNTWMGNGWNLPPTIVIYSQLPEYSPFVYTTR